MPRVFFGTPTTGKRDIIWFTLDRNKPVSLSCVTIGYLGTDKLLPSVTANSSFFTSNAILWNIREKVDII
jgi:hypothetical protein